MSFAYGILLELPHFIMERKMLLGIKERAERARGGGEGMTETSELALYPLQLRPRSHALKLAGSVLGTTRSGPTVTGPSRSTAWTTLGPP